MKPQEPADNQTTPFQRLWNSERTQRVWNSDAVQRLRALGRRIDFAAWSVWNSEIVLRMRDLRRAVYGRWRRFDKRWLAFIPAAFVIWLAALYASIAVGFTPPSQIILGAKGIEILDREGRLVFTFSDEPGSSRIVAVDEIDADLIAATVAAEDANYWDNPGVNVKGILRAVYENLAFWEHGGFFKGSGGSSITQQLAKNLYIKPEDRAKRSPLRKIKETVIAFELNRRYSKEDILSWYLSNTFYGHGAYGVESASYRYFNKPPKDLTLAEAALLAGIPRAPAVYDPITNYDAAAERQEQVLGLMVRHGVITQQQAAAALAEPVVLREGHDPNAKGSDTSGAPHFSMYVRDLLPALLGQEKVEGQLRVTTTLDLDLQAKAESVLTSNLDRLEPQVGASNGALVAMDPTTGEILAMVGSHDFNRDDISGQVNNAIALNQPGSSMKPITYLAAIMKGWSPSTIVVDEPIRIGNGESSYILGNADNRYRGAIPVRTALGSSLNVPAVKALDYAGYENVYALAKRLGLSTLKGPESYGQAFTLGGADVSLLDMTYVFSVIANHGEQAGISSSLGLPAGNRALDPIAVLKVERNDGKVLWSAKPRKERVVPANASYLVTHILSDDAARYSMFGAGSPLQLSGRKAAVKSGLTDNARDALAIGFTPQLVAGVWVGNANNKPMPGATSTYTAAPIWNAFMTAALQGVAAVDFSVPAGVEFRQVCAETGQAPQRNARCTLVNEPFLAGRTPAGTNLTPTRTPSSTPAVSATPSRTPAPRRTATPEATPTRTRTPQPSPTRTPRPEATPTRTPPPGARTPTPTRTPNPNAAPTRTPREDTNRNRPGNGNGND